MAGFVGTLTLRPRRSPRQVGPRRRGRTCSAHTLEGEIMRYRPLATLVILTAVSGASAGAQHFTGANKVKALPTPVRLDNAGRFQSTFAKVGDDIFIAGQPTERGLREL